MPALTAVNYQQLANLVSWLKNKRPADISLNTLVIVTMV